ncbi:MAG: TonB-dependent receptor plug domain-containing protein, partial [Alphaproteobacteria bacterium]|nr:TonB-dependent receptor plug domain-containing protein [Alphaproteobacteria bacterium]
MLFSRKAWLLAAVATLPVAAAAQEAQAAAEAGPLEEIVVTARKTSERLSDAPVSVSALSANRIQELGLQSIDDFAKQATGISFSQAFGRSTDRPVIRGQSNVLAGVQAGVETGAAYFVDGVYYQGDIQGFDPESIERVEIIKGPQSALYGRNTYAGAINYITKDPTDSFTGSVRATAAEYAEYQLAGSVSGPIAGEKLGFRAGGRYYTYGGQYTNQLTGKKVGDEQSTSGYLTLVFKPVDDFKMRSRVSYQHDDDGPLAIFLQGAADNNCYPG